MTDRTSHKPGAKLLCLICFLLILGSNSHWMTDTARVVAPTANCFLSPPDAWMVPLARLPWIERLADWPFLVYALAAAVMIALICRGLADEIAPLTLLAATGLSLLIQPSHLLSLLLMLFVVSARSSQRLEGRPVLQGTLIGVCGVMSVLCVLEFGLVLFVCGCAIVLTLREQRSRLRHDWWLLIPLVLAMVGIIAASVLVPGFASAMLRGVSWVWIRPSADLLPSLSASVVSRSHWLPVALLSLFFVLCWKHILARGSGARSLFAPLLLLSMMGLGCLRYLLLAGSASAALVGAAGATVAPAHRSRLAAVGLLAFAGLRLAWHTDPSYVLTGEALPLLLSPTEWNTHGRVVLLNLDQAGDWQSGECAQRFQLIVDDRWDVFGNVYPTYAEVCRDLREVRVKSYLRTDGQWGGYLRWMNEWSPALLVVDSTDVDAIRGLTLSPDWRLMGIDARRTILGQKDAPQNAAQMRTALQCLMTLEWPADLSGFSFAGTIVANNDADRRKVAGVLCAMRLPYAALRFLRQDDSRAKRILQTWCYLELAHRVHRHSGQASLLDQYRAVSMVRKAQRDGRWSATDRARIARSLAGLGLHSLARDIGLPSERGPGNPPARQTTRDAEFRQPSSADWAMAAQEQELRGALRAGDTEECERLLSSFSGPSKSYYSALASSPHRSPENLCSDLQEAVRAEGFPPDLKGEALFYLGCAAIEAGDTPLAVAALEESRQVTPAFPLRAIRHIYLGQLTRR